MTLKLFLFTQGLSDYYGAFKDEQEAYDRRAKVDPTFHYTDVRISEVKLDGYSIIVREEPDFTIYDDDPDEPEDPEPAAPIQEPPKVVSPPKVPTKAAVTKRIGRPPAGGNSNAVQKGKVQKKGR